MKNPDNFGGNKELILEIGCEGGGESIYGRKAGDDWVFWAEGGTIDADSDSDWRTWEMPQTTNLMELLPKDWIIFYPLSVHPDFTDLLRKAYDQEFAALSSEELEWKKRQKQRWDKILQR